MKRVPADAKDPKKLDIRTVAEAAGVSVATVSRVINHNMTVNAKLRQKVREAIRTLGYVPNTQARALVSGRSKMLGLIVSEITNPFFPELIQGFEDKAVEVGYETLLGSTNYDLLRMEQCVRRMMERKVEGVAVMTFGIEEPLLHRLSSQGIPMVFIDVAPKRKNIAVIHVDYDRGIREALQHLAALGHRQVGFITGPQRLHSANARLNAFLSISESIGLRVPANFIFQGDHTVEGGRCGVEQLLSLNNPPTAIMCSNDVTAIGAMHALSRAGVSIPSEMSLIGFDNVKITEFMQPPLTTIRMSGHEIAASAVDALLNRENAKKPIETRLILRQTTAAPRKTTLIHKPLDAPRKPKP